MNEELAKLPPLARLLFVGLWCHADREGRLEDRPGRIKAQVLPYDEANVNEFLTQLHDKGFIYRYDTPSGRYVQILSFLKHQKPHQKEAASIIPEPEFVHGEPWSSNNLGDGEPGGIGSSNGIGEGTDGVSIPASLNVPAFTEAWNDWHAYRRERRLAPWTERTIASKIREFESWGVERAVAAIRHSIANGYQGVFEPKSSIAPKQTMKHEDGWTSAVAAKSKPLVLPEAS